MAQAAASTSITPAAALLDSVDELDKIKDAAVLLELAIAGAREEDANKLGETGNALHTAAVNLGGNNGSVQRCERRA
jgi:hypothetical protein